MSSTNIPATDLRAGDVVVRAFDTKTIEHVRAFTHTIEDADYFSERNYPGVYVDWTDGTHTKFRPDASVDIEPRDADADFRVLDEEYWTKGER